MHVHTWIFLSLCLYNKCEAGFTDLTRTEIVRASNDLVINERKDNRDLSYRTANKDWTNEIGNKRDVK